MAEGYNQINASIYVENYSTNMEGTFSIIAHGKSELDASIQPRIYGDFDASITVRESAKNEIDSGLFVYYTDTNDLRARIKPMTSSDFNASIFVRPHNQLIGLWEVVEPPVIKSTLNPIQDAFTRNEDGWRSINFGEESLMAVGYNGSGVYRSFFKFDLSEIPDQSSIISSIAKFYIYRSIDLDNFDLELLIVSEDWSEFGITNLNEPKPIKLISDTYTYNSTDNSIEIDLTELTKNWYEEAIANYGFVLRIRDESKQQYEYIYSRESTNKPELNIEYYDTAVYSTGSSYLDASMFVWKLGESDLNTNIDVHSDWGFERLDASIYAHREDTPLYEWMDSSITSSYPFLLANIKATRYDLSEINSSISVTRKAYKTLPANIVSNKPDLISSIYVLNTSELDSSITIIKDEESVIDASITSTYPSIPSSIYVSNRNDLDTSISTSRDEDSTLSSNIDIIGLGLEDLNTSINVKYAGYHDFDSTITANAIGEDDLDSGLYVRALDNSDIDSSVFVYHYKTHDIDAGILVKKYHEISASINVNAPDKIASITPRLKSTVDLDVSMVVRAIGKHEIDATIKTNQPELLSSISPMINDELGANITVRASDESILDSDVFVKYRDEINASIMVFATSDIDTTIKTNKPDLVSSITSRIEGHSDLDTTIEARVKGFDELNASIGVGEQGAYYFIL